ncbi:MAG: protein-L-isoaspartate(D-aspartate) O-methyltransferase [Candidatus Omnitrophica bacterium]|nr:protein-L-isoaspartate(D-aspartate) O-methyltransferase [Candidatus Omnitrophota bacterium]
MARRIKSIFIAVFLFTCTTGILFAEDPYLTKRNQMVERQIKRRGIKDEKVLDAMMSVKRHLFVPENFRQASYEDTPLPIGFGQTISQPYIVAYMTEAVRLTPRDRVLEIGTGCGYQAAILARLVKEVYTIEIVRSLAESAEQRLLESGYNNIHVKWGDGYRGWPEFAPFDAIIITAAPPSIPEELVEQLKVGGRMIVPAGSFYQELYLVTRTESGYKKKSLMPVRFVPMVKGGDK